MRKHLYGTILALFRWFETSLNYAQSCWKIEFDRTDRLIVVGPDNEFEFQIITIH